MHLIHLSTVKHYTGEIEVEVAIVNETKTSCYKYIIDNYGLEKFMKLYRQGAKCHGKALTILNKYKKCSLK